MGGGVQGSGDGVRVHAGYPLWPVGTLRCGVGPAGWAVAQAPLGVGWASLSVAWVGERIDEAGRNATHRGIGRGARMEVPRTRDHGTEGGGYYLFTSATGNLSYEHILIYSLGITCTLD